MKDRARGPPARSPCAEIDSDDRIPPLLGVRTALRGFGLEGNVGSVVTESKKAIKLLSITLVQAGMKVQNGS